MSPISSTKPGLAALPIAASRRKEGRISRKSSSRLPASSRDCCDNPVTLPPGRARLAIKPVPIGSLATANTMGMTDVTCFAAGTASPDVTITSTLSPTNSAAISAKRSLRPSAQRVSIATVRPSTQPSSFSRCTNAAVQELQLGAEPEPRKPIFGNLPDCCARAASGHAVTALPSSVMNSRRLMGCPQAEDHTLPYCEKSALCITAKSAARLPRWVRPGQTDHLPARLGHGAYDSVSGHPRNFFVAPQFVKALTHSNGRPAMARDLVSPLV